MMKFNVVAIVPSSSQTEDFEKSIMIGQIFLFSLTPTISTRTSPQKPCPFFK